MGWWEFGKSGRAAVQDSGTSQIKVNPTQVRQEMGHPVDWAVQQKRVGLSEDGVNAGFEKIERRLSALKEVGDRRASQAASNLPHGGTNCEIL